jgi:hypothetical protein
MFESGLSLLSDRRHEGDNIYYDAVSALIGTIDIALQYVSLYR